MLLRSESAASSQIENLTSSARALAEAEIGEGARANAAVILANVRTMQAALDLAGRLDEAAVLAMHRALMSQQSVHAAGAWREQQVWVGGSPLHPGDAHYVPPVAADVPGLMADLVRFMDRDDLPPLAHAALAHAQFETIHPFTDGNGRTGRALLHSVLLHTGAIRRVTVPISAGLLALRDDYFAALTAYRKGDAEPILRCVAEAARSGTHIGERLVATLRGVRDEWAEQLTARAGSASWGAARPAPAPARRHGARRRPRARGDAPRPRSPRCSGSSATASCSSRPVTDATASIARLPCSRRWTNMRTAWVGDPGVESICATSKFAGNRHYATRLIPPTAPTSPTWPFP